MPSDEPAVVGGLYEICIGVPDTDEAVKFWECFGYRRGSSGRLPERAAARLYGVPSELTSTRLLHQESDHGLIRLMEWKRPLGPGLNMARLRTKGCRWGVHKTEDMITLLNHAEVWEAQGKPLNRLGPLLNANILGPDAPPQKPFEEPIVCLREFQIFQPLYQLVITKRYNLALPLYGRVNRDSLFRCSQVIHAGLGNDLDDLDAYSFYDDVLGLKRMADWKVDHGLANISDTMMDLKEGESFTIMDFDDVRSEKPHEKQRSGRLRIFNFHSVRQEDDRMDDSRPGNLGYSLYTYRVNDLSRMRDKIKKDVTDLTEIHEDEFGTPAISFVAPDGFNWTLMAAN